MRSSGHVHHSDDVVDELKSFSCDVDVHDPWANPAEALTEYGIELVAAPEKHAYDAVILAVAHISLTEQGAESNRAYCRDGGVFFDLKSAFPISDSDLRL